ncbi:SDR family oxidoreductase [Comamonas testosteroni]|uniref:SDR family oxidoreductase n=1 Tax=Comamonas testosteroni TaxID=285 RepID=A0A373FMH4_COMTE|nr:SDR family oxidoreductase [Comamonas testosteroni]RGE45364.1 SDR family oxidoreductase [Comamonas testosteroni]
MNVQFDFSGRHVMVFGGTTGINLGIAQRYAETGAKVTVVSRKQANVDAAVATLGADALGVVGDVRDEQAVAAALEQAVARHGPVDVLVSGAAGNFLAPADQMSANAFKVVVDIDLLGSFHVARQALPHLRTGNSSLIFITAPQSTVPMMYQAHVCAAKAGVDHLARVLALEWGAKGVRVNAISPGPIAGTEGMRRLAPQGAEGDALVRQMVPLGRMGTTDDIAQLALFLGSDAASYISGTVIACDGGAQGQLSPMITAAAAAAVMEQKKG